MDLRTWLTTLFILLRINSSIQNFSCDKIDHTQTNSRDCSCITGPNYSEIFCENYLTAIFSIQENFNKLKIDCTGSQDTWNLAALPTLNIGTVDKISFSHCPFTSNGFEDVLKALGAECPLAIKIVKPISPNNVTLNKSYFTGLEKVRQIVLHATSIFDLEENVFEGMKDLETVDFELNNFQKVPQVFQNADLSRLHINYNFMMKLNLGDFSQTPNLEILELQSNLLDDLETGIFTNLSRLYSLDLSNNIIRNAPEDIFEPLRNLIKINLMNCHLEEIPEGLLRSNVLLKEVRLSFNPLVNGIPENLLANLSQLQTVWLDYCELDEVPEYLLDGCINLTELSLQNNNLESLPRYFFESSPSVNILKLSSNKIVDLPNDIFAGLTELEELDLNNNAIQILNEDLLKPLTSLMLLDLSDNNIVTIHKFAFINNERLNDINLQNNMLTFVEYSLFRPFEYCRSLTRLNLRRNEIENFFDGWFPANLTTLDLGENRIRELKISPAINRTTMGISINLRDNLITNINLDLIEKFMENLSLCELDHLASEFNTVVNLFVDYNPINCDCESLSLVNYFQGNLHEGVRVLINLPVSNLVCEQPKNLKFLHVEDLKPDMLSCPVVSKDVCPEDCSCSKQPYNRSLVIDCSNRDLRVAPKINQDLGGTFYNKIKVNLQGNNLTSWPGEDMGYGNVTELLLSNNWISEVGWIPPKLEVLELNNNNLTNINTEVLLKFNNSKSLRTISLHNNPWECNCSIFKVSEFILQNLNKVSNVNISCSNDHQLLIHLKHEDICPSNFILYLSLVIVSISILSLVLVLGAIYYKFEQQMIIWLFTHKMLLWCINEDDVDKDKQFDAFISYSSNDEDFVVSNLLPFLEAGPTPYKVCVHFRDWKVGDNIAEQISKSVANSKRTIVVLSQNFLDSIWGKMEFRVAHETAMKERRARLIVIVYGNQDMNKGVFDEVKTYLDTKTYIKWGDPAFWQKLKFALPHVHFLSEVRTNENLEGKAEIV